MFKYISVSKNSFAELLAYRLNFVLWRLRVIISILITYFLWSAIYSGKTVLFNYTAKEMFTYIVLLAFLNGVVLSTQTFRVAEEINNGSLSNYLIRPINYIKYNLFRDLADKSVNTFFSVLETALMLSLSKPPFIFQHDMTLILLFILSVVIAVGLYFFISLILSFIGFWSREVWAPRFIFFIIVAFLAGTYFPLDIVPSVVYSVIQFLPFTYLVFFPLKIYLGHITTPFLLMGFSVSIIWLFILYGFTKFIWSKGLKVYTAEGK